MDKEQAVVIVEPKYYESLKVKISKLTTIIGATYQNLKQRSTRYWMVKHE